MGVNKQRDRPAVAAALDHSERALAMRITGASFQKIGVALGITRQGARLAYLRALETAREELAESAAEHVELECQRIDALLAAVWHQAEAGDPEFVASALKIMERRAKLLGLDAAAKTELTGKDGGAINIADARAVLLARLAGSTASGDSGGTSGGTGEPA